MKRIIHTILLSIFLFLFSLTSYPISQAQDTTIFSKETRSIVLSPGSSDADLNFCWYAKRKGKPAVKLSTSLLFSTSQIFTGTSKKIKRNTGTITYHASNKINITDYFQENTKYYYQYTDDYHGKDTVWSSIYTYETGSFQSVSAILVGDPQIGASGSISQDARNWTKTLETALTICPNPSFLLSTGDQIDKRDNSSANGLRERQYGGLLSPSALRSLPFATTIGNHDSKVSDYQYHFNNPNTKGKYGATKAGCDYYFNRGNALFIVLNSNNRNVSKHRKLMKKAIRKYPSADWRIVIFHHDIYGSGAAHSNRSSANLRPVFAPLMDEFHIDLVFTGHDHSYARSYSMIDGVALKTDATTLTNPIGTTYITLGTSSGSKIYGLAKRQYYVAERFNSKLPTFSHLTINGTQLTLRTYNYNQKKCTEDFTIIKTTPKENPVKIYKKAISLKKTNYTKTSFQQLKQARTAFKKATFPILSDKGAKKIASKYRTDTDPLSYYGYAAGTTKALPKGFSTLLDKTSYKNIALSADKYLMLWDDLKTSLEQLEKK